MPRASSKKADRKHTGAVSQAELTLDQDVALQSLRTSELNLFLTGSAGTGKSFVIRQYLHDKSAKEVPIVASTGAAAILVGGRTFHSFFGLGILEGGVRESVERALKRKPIVKRLQKCREIVIDEVSMISGSALDAAEKIARGARENDSPWGGLRVIAVGDFLQLPPVSRAGQSRDWAFHSEAWERSGFETLTLRQIKRTEDSELTRVLMEVRSGRLGSRSIAYLNSKVTADDSSFTGTRLFPRRDAVEAFNQKRLSEIPGKLRQFPTEYLLKREVYREALMRDAPLPPVLSLKEGALIMLRNNDPEQKWVNGSLGHVRRISDHALSIELMNGRDIEVEPMSFELLDGEGQVMGAARNFPVNLAYATTIHKAQGMTLDSVRVDLRGAWEHGQAYVAMSRVRSGAGLTLQGWTQGSIVVDPVVLRFCESDFISE